MEQHHSDRGKGNNARERDPNAAAVRSEIVIRHPFYDLWPSIS
jgi:hypothetical protein